MPDFKSIGTTVRGRAATELRDRILTGQLRPGERLDLDTITEEFGTSRTPVREALLELSYEGLVAVAPRSGITVLGITPRDAVDNFAVLAALTGKAAEWATTRITAAQRSELLALANAVVTAEDVVAANWRFHRALNLASGSPRRLTLPRAEAVRAAPQLLRAVPRAGGPGPRGARPLLAAMSAATDAGARADRRRRIVLRAGEALGDWLITRMSDEEVGVARGVIR